jgi:5-methylcytosine-specific restriction endonuclease McrA
MPSSPNYVRDIKQETKTAKARGEIGGHNAPHAKRMRARRLLVKKGLVKPNDGKDVDHKVPLSKGGGESVSNLRVVTDNNNRSFPRNKNGSLKKNT